MTPQHPNFDAHVQSAVDPIPANPLRKRAMREELLAHLIGAYEQELQESESTQIAVAEAKKRFGNLEVFREELRHSVPLLERLIFQFFTPREPIMVRWILLGIAFFLIGMSMILPAMAQIRDGKKFTSDAVIHFAIGLGIVAVGIAFSVYKVVKRSRKQTVTPR